MGIISALSLRRWQLIGLTVLSLAVGGITAFARSYLGERQTVEWLVAMNAGGYEAAIAVLDSERMKATHLDAPSLFSQFVSEFANFQGEPKPRAVDLTARRDKNASELATLLISGRSEAATTRLMEQVSNLVRDRIVARTRAALSESRAQLSARTDAGLSALMSYQAAQAASRSADADLQESRPASGEQVDPTSPSPGAAVEIPTPAPNTVVYATDPIVEQMGRLMVTKRMLDQIDIQQLQIPIYSLSQQRIESSPLNLPVWLAAVLAATSAAVIGYGSIVASRLTKTEPEDPKIPSSQKDAGPVRSKLRVA